MKTGLLKLLYRALLIASVMIMTDCKKTEDPTPNVNGGSTGSSSGGSGGSNTTQTGTATFFTKEDLGVGVVTVYVDGNLEGTISHYHVNGVTCGQGDVNVTKPAGTYPFKATGGSQVWEGTITIKNGVCQAQELLKGTSGGNTGGGNTTTQGQVTFWTAQASGWSSIDVSVEGAYVGSITKYYASAPACGASGCVTITKAPGTYAFTAKSKEGTTWSGNVTITANGCATNKLTFSNSGGSGSGSGGNCDWTSALNCAKVVAKKGTRCGEATSLDVTITNGCTVPVKFYVCIQNSDGTWTGLPDGTFEAGTAPGKTGNWYGCKTTNQYKYGAMTAADFVKNKCAYPKCN